MAPRNRRLKQLHRFFRDGVPNTPVGHSLIKRTLRGLTQAESNNLDSILVRHMAMKALRLRSHTYATSTTWTDLSSKEEWQVMELFTHKEQLIDFLHALMATMQASQAVLSELQQLLALRGAYQSINGSTLWDTRLENFVTTCSEELNVLQFVHNLQKSEVSNG